MVWSVVHCDRDQYQPLMSNDRSYDCQRAYPFSHLQVGLRDCFIVTSWTPEAGTQIWRCSCQSWEDTCPVWKVPQSWCKFQWNCAVLSLHCPLQNHGHPCNLCFRDLICKFSNFILFMLTPEDVSLFLIVYPAPLQSISNSEKWR